MRKFLITLLLASAAATPALAGPRDHSDSDRQQAREDRQAAHEERQQARQESRSERAAERPSFTPRSVDAPQARPQFSGNPNGGEFRGGRNADRGNFSGQAGNYVAPGAHMVTPGDRGNRGPRVVDLEQRRQDRVDARE